MGACDFVMFYIKLTCQVTVEFCIDKSSFVTIIGNFMSLQILN